MRFKRFAKGHAKGRKVGQNKVEALYQAALEQGKRDGVIQEYGYEWLTLKLADDTRYTPDFFVLANDDVIECHEVKAGMKRKVDGEIVPLSEDASKIKIKVAAERFPFRFVLAYHYKGTWGRKEYSV